MDISGNIHSPLSFPGKLTKDPSDRPVHVTSSVTSSSSTPSKTVPFIPRVLLSVQQPLPHLINQAALVQASVSNSTPITSQNVLSHPHISSFHMSTTSVATPINSSSQFFPLILAATSAVPPNTSTASGTPLQLHLNTYSGGSTCVTSSAPSIILQPNIIPGSASVPVQSSLSSPTRINPPANAATSTPLVASLIGRTCSSSAAAIASVVISPQTPSSMHPTLAWRFTTRTPTHSGNTVTTTTAVNSANSSVFDTSSNVISNTLRSNAVTASNLPTSTPSVSGSLLMSSTISSTPRVLIHKPTQASHCNQASLTSGDNYLNVVASVNSPSKSSLSFPDHTLLGPTATSVSNVTFVVHDQFSAHSPQPAKAKVMSFATPVSASVRLITASSTIGAIHKSVPTTSVSGTGLVTLPASSLHHGINAAKAPSSISAAPTSSQSLILQASELAVHSTLSNSSLNTNLITSLRTFSGASSSTSSAVPLPGTGHAVLAFNLANSPVSSITTCSSTTGLLPSPLRPINPGANQTPLIIRANGPSTVGFMTATTTVSPLASASLLKPFSLNLSGNLAMGSSFLPSATTSSGNPTPQILPVNIAPAKLTSLQPSGPASTASVAPGRSSFPHGVTPLNTHRQPSSSIFPQPSRKRARKQQLASAFSSVIVSTMSVVSSASGGVSPCQRSHISPTSGLVNMTKPTVQSQNFVQPAYAHGSQTSAASVRSNNITCDLVSKCLSTTIPVNALNCSTSVINSSTNGFMGIRLLSVRTTPNTLTTGSNSVSLLNTSCIQSFPTSATSTTGCCAGNISDATSLMVVTPSSPITSCSSQLRITTHSSQGSDIQHPQPATVYVLTTSGYPTLNSTSTSIISTIASSETEAISPISSPSTNTYNTTVMVPGMTPNVMQVRFRSPQSSNLLTSISTGSLTTDVELDGQVYSQSMLSTPVVSTSYISGLDVSRRSDEESHPQVSPNKPIRCSSSGSSNLLHQLVSSQKQNELPTDLHSKGSDIDQNKMEINRTLSNVSPLSYELSTTQLWLNELDNEYNRIRDSKTLVSLESETLEERNINNSNRDEETLNHAETRTDYMSEVCSQNDSHKQTKFDFENKSDPKSVDDKSRSNSRNFKRSFDMLWAVDPIDGREWILNGRPPRPLICSKYGSTSQNGTSYRPKATHFLSHSEIRLRSQLKSGSGNSESTNRTSFQTTRRRRRNGLSLPSRCSTNASERVASAEDGESIKAIKLDSEGLSIEKNRIVQDVLAVRSEQEELDLIQYPVTITSMLNLTGWRTLICANNLDLLAYTELQTLQSVRNLETALLSQSSQSQASTSDTKTNSALKTNERLSNYDIFNDSQSNLAKFRTSSLVNSYFEPTCDFKLTAQLNKAIELIKSVAQRKIHLLNSIQRLNSRTKNLVEHFSIEVIKLIEDVEESFSTSGGTFPSPTSPKRTILDVSLAADINSRKSTRRRSLNNLPVRRIRGRNHGGVINESKPSNSLIKNTPSNNYTGSSNAQSAVCISSSNSCGSLR